MKQVSGKRFCRILEAHGNHPIKKGLLDHFVKVAGLKEEDL